MPWKRELYVILTNFYFIKMRNDEEIVVRNCCDVVACVFAECINMRSDVGQERGALPPPFLHDNWFRDPGKDQHHGEAGPDRVCPDLFVVDSEPILSYQSHRCPELCTHGVSRDRKSGSVEAKCVDVSATGRIWVTSNAVGDARPEFDRAHV